MSIDSIASCTVPDVSAARTTSNPFKQDFQSLQTALAAGDLQGAQKAFAAIQQDMAKFRGNNKTDGGGTSQTGTNPVQKDLQALQSALSEGDMDAAKQAFASLQSDIKSSRAHHGHHRHQQESSSATDPSNTTISSTNSDSTTGTLLNVTV